jgi:hypothetical protein
MGRQRKRLTKALEAQIFGFVRAGGFPQVSAQAAGIGPNVLTAWLRQGRRPDAREPYRSFACGFDQAVAMSRLKAEIEVREKDPRFWLKHGPGRERPLAPGWTNPVKALASHEAHADPLVMLEWNRLTQRLLTALEGFPEARKALAAALDEANPF